MMSYLYGCDVIMHSCDVMQSECDVIHIECNVIQRVGEIQLVHGFDDTDTVDMISNIVGVMRKTRWFEIIK